MYIYIYSSTGHTFDSYDIKFKMCFLIGMEKPNVKSYNIANCSWKRFNYITKKQLKNKKNTGKQHIAVCYETTLKIYLG